MGTKQLSFTMFILAVVATQVASQYYAPPLVPTYSPLIPTLPPVVSVNPIVDVQAYTGLPCGCSSCGCSGCSSCPYSATLYDCSVPTSVSVPACGCSVPCGCGSVPCPCGCGTPLVTVPYSSYQAPCGCGLTTPLLPPLPPVVGCSKHLRQVCTQPPFL